MHFFNQRRASVFMVVSLLFVGCVAHHADGPDRQKQERVSNQDPVIPTIEVASDEEDQRSIQEGKALFHGKAACFECHGDNGDITHVSQSRLARLHPPPTDLRTPNDRSLRQLYLIIRYGISGTGMLPLVEATALNDEEIFHVISYLTYLQGRSPSIDLISNLSVLPQTDTDVAISLICDQEALDDVDKEERCEDRYAKRYRDLIVGRPPDISINRYKEIEENCKRLAAKDLDSLALCYRAEYQASRPPIRKMEHDQ